MTIKPKWCWLCGCSVSLEDCKIDERGFPVHEKCYAAKVVLASRMREQALVYERTPLKRRHSN
jgi:hypothetical protein